jgi:hypothetical protein
MRLAICRFRWICAACLSALAAAVSFAQTPSPPGTRNPPPAAAQKTSPKSWEEVDRDIAARFAPGFYQGVIGTERFDFMTNFDFDGDWLGDNNWSHAADKRYSLKAYVYYSVSETPTHYFVHYAVFHPRDWKGGEKTGRVLSTTIRETTTVGGKVKTKGLADDIVLAHENDLEGCLVVVAKRGAALDAARVVFVETVAHNRYLRAAPEPRGDETEALRLDNQHPLLYIEPGGHGISAFHDQPVRPAKSPAVGAADDSAEAPKEAQKKGLLDKMKKVTKGEGPGQERTGRSGAGADRPASLSLLERG